MAKAAAAAVIWISVLITSSASAQKLSRHTANTTGICETLIIKRIEMVSPLNDCEVVLGNLKLMIFENGNKERYRNISFPKLKEVTGFMVIYRLIGLQSLDNMFPNLARIRGRELIYNFALVVYDMPELMEVGPVEVTLPSLIKIDRGGVAIWGGLDTCNIYSVDWESIAPQSHIVLSSPDGKLNACHHKDNCNCSHNPQRNYCWNHKTCQRFIEGPEAEVCHEQCLGCSRSNPNDCTVCRHYTHQGQCVPKCPDDTIILWDNKYCLTKEECRSLNGWTWNNTCISDCPLGFDRHDDVNGNISCQICKDCKKTCPSKNIQTLSAIQHTDKCTLINGSLIIHSRSIPQAVDELRKFLKGIEEVTDYIVIYDSSNIISLDFLPSLKKIGGNKLIYGKYSLVIKNLKHLKQIFDPNVTKNLRIDRGTMLVHGNPLLCVHEIAKLEQRFPVRPEESDIPIGLNGYSGNCSEASQIVKVNIRTETSATVFFSPQPNPKVYYKVLYMQLPLESQNYSVPETCSKRPWQTVNGGPSAYMGIIELNNLMPASNYAICLETLDTEYSSLVRSSITHFTTPFDRPEPPFIWELNATSPTEILLRWIDHRHYYKLITHYELDVTLIEIPKHHQTARDHCEYPDEYFHDTEIYKHVLLVKPPKEYFRYCDSSCDMFSQVADDEIFEDFFDVCTSEDHRMNVHEPSRPGNSTFEKYIKTLSVDINVSMEVFTVTGLAPYRDYKFRLRSCAKDKCSISFKNVIRTLKSKIADIPTIERSTVNQYGHVSIVWKPPNTTNGPVLAYSVQIQVPSLQITNMTKMDFVDSFCVSPHDHSTVVVLEFVAPKYLVRVCATTLGSFSRCAKWQEITMEEKSLVWLWVVSSIIFIVWFLYLAVTFFRKRRKVEIDGIPLIDLSTANRNETDPPVDLDNELGSPVYTFPVDKYDIPLVDISSSTRKEMGSPKPSVSGVISPVASHTMRDSDDDSTGEDDDSVD